MFNTMQTYDRYLPDAVTIPFAAHSIYFQAMGEHGFVGLALLLALGAAVWRTAGRLIVAPKASEEFIWAGQLGRALQTALVGFSVGGAFLTLLHFDVPYYMAILAVAAAREVRTQGAVASGRTFPGRPAGAATTPPAFTDHRVGRSTPSRDGAR